MTKSMRFANHRVVGTVLVAVLWSAVVRHASMQTAPTGAWAGWARCQVDVQGPGYVEHQTHTWTIAGSTPTVEGAFRVFPGTWSVVGGGTLQRTQGTQTLNVQWAINVPGMSAPIAVFVRASDGRMFIQARHAQLRSSGAVAGYQQQTIDGKAQPPAQIAAEAFEWSFPVIGAASTSTSVSGSSAPVVNGSVGYMQPAGSRGTASCTWQFGQGAAAPAPPSILAAQAIPIPSSTTPTPAVSSQSAATATTSGIRSASVSVAAAQDLRIKSLLPYSTTQTLALMVPVFERQQMQLSPTGDVYALATADISQQFPDVSTTQSDALVFQLLSHAVANLDARIKTGDPNAATLQGMIDKDSSLMTTLANLLTRLSDTELSITQNLK